MIYDEAIEKLTVYFTSPKYEDEVLQAKSEFFRDVGIDDKENDRYEQWMNLFFDWYLFSRPLSGSTLPPSKFAVEIDEFQQVMKEDEDVFQRLSNCEHSLYQFVKVKGTEVHFKDLLRKKKRVVMDTDIAVTLEKGALCNVRLIANGEKYNMSKGFCTHPMEANKFILKEVKTLLKQEDEQKEGFLLELLRMFFKMEQYSHLKHDQVYTRHSKVRF